MRDILRRLREAGIRRARFSAYFSGVSEEGFLILEQVQPPVGELDHIWLRPNERLPGVVPGSVINFLADIRPYQRLDGSEDLGLFGVRLL